jgi:hypothetical protein
LSLGPHACGPEQIRHDHVDAATEKGDPRCIIRSQLRGFDMQPGRAVETEPRDGRHLPADRTEFENSDPQHRQFGGMEHGRRQARARHRQESAPRQPQSAARGQPSHTILQDYCRRGPARGRWQMR